MSFLGDIYNKYIGTLKSTVSGMYNGNTDDMKAAVGDYLNSDAGQSAIAKYTASAAPATTVAESPTFKQLSDSLFSEGSLFSSSLLNNLSKYTTPTTATVTAPTATTTTSGYVYGNDALGQKANNAAVNALYQAYFGRDASQAELNNWGDTGGSGTTVKALEDFLQSERTKYGVTTPVKTLDELTGGSSNTSVLDKTISILANKINEKYPLILGDGSLVPLDSMNSTVNDSEVSTNDYNFDFSGMTNPSYDYSSYAQSLADLFNQRTEKQTALDEERKTLLGQVTKLMNTDMSSTYKQLLKDFGIPEMQTDLAELNSMIATRTGEYAQGLTELQGKPILTSHIIGKSANLERQKLAELGTLNAIAEAKQGNITMANDIISNMLDMDYKDMQNKLSALSTQLDANYDSMSAEDQRQANYIQQKIAEQNNLIEDERSNREAIFNIAVKAIEGGADNNAIMDILKSNLNDALAKAAPYLKTGTSYEILKEGDIVFDPVTGQAIYTAPSTSGYTTVNAGDTLINPATGEVVYSAPTKLEEGQVLMADNTVGDTESLGLADQLYQAIVDLVGDGTEANPGVAWEQIVGPVEGHKPASLLVGNDSILAASLYEQIKANLALAKTKFIKGNMSEKELELVNNASTALDRRLDENSFRTILEDLRDGLTDSSNRYSYTKIDPKAQEAVRTLYSGGVPMYVLESNYQLFNNWAREGANVQDIIDTFLDEANKANQ